MNITRPVLLNCGACAVLAFSCTANAQVSASMAGQAAQAWVAQVKVSRGIVRIERGGQR